LSFEFPNTTERYEGDFAAVFLLAAFAAWFALSTGAAGARRKAVHVIGAVFALWGCVTGVAISLNPGDTLLHAAHPGTWTRLENATSPISTAIAMLVGHPILGSVEAPKVARISPVRLTSIGAGVESVSLRPGTSAQLTIVSPDERKAAIVANVQTGVALHNGRALAIQIKDASPQTHDFFILHNGVARIPVELNRGLDRVRLTPAPALQELLVMSSLTLASKY
jgi:hypothetical protein